MPILSDAAKKEIHSYYSQGEPIILTEIRIVLKPDMTTELQIVMPDHDLPGEYEERENREMFTGDTAKIKVKHYTSEFEIDVKRHI
jgi:hypothetical protein